MTPAASKHIQEARRAERIDRAHRDLADAHSEMRHAARTARAEALANATAHLREAERKLSDAENS